MKVVIWGASGMIGSRVLEEALQRGHQVTALARDPSRITKQHSNLRVQKGDITNPGEVTATAVGQDAVINTTSPGRENSREKAMAAAHSLIQGLRNSPSTRLIVVAGAGSLYIRPGEQFVDSPEFDVPVKDIPRAMRDALEVYRNSGLNWTAISPAAQIRPGEKTGVFRLGTDQLLRNEKGESKISAEDFAVALVDELEKPQFVGRRFTLAY